MGNVFLGDFETGDTSQFTSASGAIESTIVKKGLYSGKNSDNQNFTKTLASALSTIYIHGYFRLSVDPSSSVGWFVVVGSGETTGQFSLRLTNGRLYFYLDNNPTAPYMGSTQLTNDVWYEIEIKFVTHDSTGSFEVRINGQTEIIASALDTKNSTDTGIKTVKWQGINAAGYCYVDQCAINDDTWYYNPDEFIIKITKDTYDALTEENPNNIIYHSKYNTLKYYLSGNSSITVVGDGSDKSTTVEVTHSLGFFPVGIVYVNFFTQNSPTSLQYAIVPHVQNTLTTKREAHAWIDANKLYLQLMNKSSSTYTAVFYYKIFKNRLGF